MLGEITHLQPIVDDLTVLTEDPHKLPPASEQVTRVQYYRWSDLKCSGLLLIFFKRPYEIDTTIPPQIEIYSYVYKYISQHRLRKNFFCG